MSDQQTMPRQRKIGLIIASIAGLIYGTSILWNFTAFSWRASETQGRIVARDSFTFTIQYAVDGRTYQIQQDLPGTRGMSGIKRMQLQPGAAVTVLYDPSSPGDARWKSNRNLVFPFAVIFIALLAGFAGMFPELALRSFSGSRNSGA